MTTQKAKSNNSALIQNSATNFNKKNARNSSNGQISVFQKMLISKENTLKSNAKEIHGEILPLLSVLKMKLQTIKNKRTKIPPAKVFESEIKIIDDVVLLLRKINGQLYPSSIDLVGLLKALEGLVWKQNQKQKQECFYFYNVCTPLFSVQREHEILIYRIFELTLEFYSQIGNVEISIRLRNTSRAFTIQFVCELLDNISFSEPHLQHLMKLIDELQTSLLLVNGKVSKTTNWFEHTEIIIPIFDK